MTSLIFAAAPGGSLCASVVSGARSTTRQASCLLISRQSRRRWGNTQQQQLGNCDAGVRFLHSTRLGSKPRVIYRIAASCSAKGHRFHPLENSYNFDPDTQDVPDLIPGSTDYPPKYKKRLDSGEDAFFVGPVGSKTGAVAFGVADGVGGWTESRVDPADFSHGLCNYMEKAARAWDNTAERLRPKNLIQMGYDKVLEDGSISAGGSTASVGVAQKDGKVELANLGDSGSVLLRLAAVHHYSTPQTHTFNAPYQLSLIPPRMRAQASVFGGSFFEDFPRDAAVANVSMQHGDVLVLATDGVFDNLNNQDILKIVTGRMIVAGAWTGTAAIGIGVSKQLDDLTRPGGIDSIPSWSAPPPLNRTSQAAGSHPPGVNPTDKIQTPSDYNTLQVLLASSIAGEAKLASIDFRRDGPFAKEAQRYYPWEWYRGGKVDDICVVVVIAVEVDS